MAGADGTAALVRARGRVYGRFEDTAPIAAAMIAAMAASPRWATMPATARVAAMMIAVKLSRLVNGGGVHADSWRDIAGYAHLAQGAAEGGDG